MATTGFSNPEIRLGYMHNLSGKVKQLKVETVQGRYRFSPGEPGDYHFTIYVKDPSFGPDELAFFGPVVKVAKSSRQRPEKLAKTFSMP